MTRSKAVSLCAILFFCASNFTNLASASSPAAWSAHDREVANACAKASGLKDAVATGEPMVFDDSVGMTALLVSGRYPQPHMKNQRGHALCLFDRKTREAKIAPADQLRWTATAKTGKK